jgi:FkbM family methyltransferase
MLVEGRFSMTESSEEETLESFVCVNIADVSFLHRLGFQYAYFGFRGSHLVWKFIDKLVKRPSENAIVVLPTGMPLVYNHNDWTSRSIFEGSYERPLLWLLRSYNIQNRYVDVGANVGVTLWHALINAKDGAKWRCYEPSARCLIHLKVLASHLTAKGEISSKAIGSKNEFSRLNGAANPRHSGLGTLREITNEVGDSVSVEVTTLDCEFSDTSVIIDLLKVDTEGYESEVLKGAQKLLREARISDLILEVSPEFGSLDYLSLLKQILPIGYEWFRIEESGTFRKKLHLITTNLNECYYSSRQFNLLISRNTKN